MSINERKIIEKEAYEKKYGKDFKKILKVRKWEIEKPYSEFNQRFVHFFNLKIIKSFLKTIKNKRILIVAAGPGMEAEYFEKLGAKVFCTDISRFQIINAKLRKGFRNLKYNLIIADAENQPFKMKYFDYSLIYESLHHVPNFKKAIKEMIKVTKNKIVICEPNSESLSSRIINFLKIKLTEWGFDMIKFNRNDVSNLFKGRGEIKIKYGCVSVPSVSELLERLKLSKGSRFVVSILNFFNIMLNLIWYINPKLGSAIIGYLKLKSLDH